MKDFKFVLAAALFLLPRTARAQVPSTINFQGRLADSAGSPITGTQSMVFSIFNALTSGSQLWTETQSVALSSGIYNVALGSVVGLSTSVFVTPSTFLQIQVGADPAMTPRIQFRSVPYAFNAQNLLSILPLGD